MKIEGYVESGGWYWIILMWFVAATTKGFELVPMDHYIEQNTGCILIMLCLLMSKLVRISNGLIKASKS